MSSPAVEAEVKREGLGSLDDERTFRGEAREGHVAAPEPGLPPEGGGALVACSIASSSSSGRRAVAGSEQLEELGVRPDERHRAAARLAGEEAAFRDRVAVPDLLGDAGRPAGHAAPSSRGTDRGSSPASSAPWPRSPGQQRPGAADAGAVEGAAVGVLAVAVVVIAAVGGAVRRFDSQEGVDDRERVAHVGGRRSGAARVARGRGSRARRARRRRRVSPPRFCDLDASRAARRRWRRPDPDVVAGDAVLAARGRSPAT